MIPQILLVTNKTSGHISNMIAIAESLPSYYNIIFLIGNNDHEYNIISNTKYEYIIYKSWIQLFKIFSKGNIIYVLSSGGGFSFPVLTLAKSYNIKTGILEPNYFPGQATLALSYLSQTFGVNSEYKAYYDNFNLIENPVRMQIKNLKIKSNLTKVKKVLLVMGGSNGIKSLNESILDNIEIFKDIKLIWITGRLFDYSQKINSENIKIYSYVQNINQLYKEADLVISAAGANSIQELLLLKIPFLLYPLKNSKYNHQFKNALFITRKIPNIIYKDPNEILKQSIKILSNKDILIKYQENIKIINYKGNAQLIIDKIYYNMNLKFSFIRLLTVLFMTFLLYCRFTFLKYFDETIFNFKKILKEDYIEYKDIPESLIKCIILREDGNFMNHQGYPYRKKTILYLIVGIFKKIGCSGIVQQLIRNLFYEIKSNKIYNLKRKIYELFITYFVNKFYSKEQILEYYCNIICYLDFKNKTIDKFGIKYLAKIIFDKDINKLKLIECMLISVVLTNPILYISQIQNNNISNKIFVRLFRLLDDLKYIKYIDNDKYLSTKEDLLNLKQLNI
jgi:UDP-N-acetylglucosamine--N-acetylmuramyl-(pentapeptide) pyrophosphoryl-undecaprenol N-acetylglucosamine transferase